MSTESGVGRLDCLSRRCSLLTDIPPTWNTATTNTFLYLFIIIHRTVYMNNIINNSGFFIYSPTCMVGVNKNSYIQLSASGCRLKSKLLRGVAVYNNNLFDRFPLPFIFYLIGKCIFFYLIIGEVLTQDIWRPQRRWGIV